ncbi:MAG: AI-2E family transporter [Thermoanaerobaculia bacterium]|nr:AI-2E family transporter [Thermoanaerobaculia bacterium]
MAGLKAAAPLLLPLLLALFLATLTLPLLAWLRRFLPDGLAVLVTVLAALGFVIGAGLLISESVSGFVEAAPRYQERLKQVVFDLDGWLDIHQLPTTEELGLGEIDPSSILDLAVGTLRGLAAVVTNLFLVFLTLVFLLLEVLRLPEKLSIALNDSGATLRRWSGAIEHVQKYLVIKTIVSVVTGVVIGLGTALVGLDFPLLWGILAFLFNYIPNLGSILAAIPACLLALAQLGPVTALGVALLYGGVNLLLGNLLEPQLLGRRLGLSPLVVFASLVFWGWVWGPIGMFLSVPLTVIVRIVLESSEEYSWVASLLAARPRAAAIEATPS